MPPRITVTRLQSWLYRLGKSLSIPGFQARALWPNREEHVLIEQKLRAAVRLLEAHSPIRLQHLRRDLPRLWISATHYAGQSMFSAQICVLGFDHVIAATTTPEDVAAILVHEGSHARLTRAGFRYAEATRGQIERLCIRSEMIVARRFAKGQSIVASAERRLAFPLEHWSTEAMREYDLAAMRRSGWFGKLGYHVGRGLVALGGRRKSAA